MKYFRIIFKFIIAAAVAFPSVGFLMDSYGGIGLGLDRFIPFGYENIVGISATVVLVVLVYFLISLFPRISDLNIKKIFIALLLTVIAGFTIPATKYVTCIPFDINGWSACENFAPPLYIIVQGDVGNVPGSDWPLVSPLIMEFVVLYLLVSLYYKIKNKGKVADTVPQTPVTTNTNSRPKKILLKEFFRPTWKKIILATVFAPCFWLPGIIVGSLVQVFFIGHSSGSSTSELLLAIICILFAYILSCALFSIRRENMDGYLVVPLFKKVCISIVLMIILSFLPSVPIYTYSVSSSISYCSIPEYRGGPSSFLYKIRDPFGPCADMYPPALLLLTGPKSMFIPAIIIDFIVSFIFVSIFFRKKKIEITGTQAVLG